MEGAVQRARSLVVGDSASLSDAVLGDVETAAHSVTATSHATGEMAGALVAQHKRFAVNSTVRLMAAGRTDAILQTEMAMASAIARTGREHLDAVYVQSRATSRAGVFATTPAAQRVILTALRSQLAQAAQAVDSVRRDGAALSEAIRSLQYEIPAAPPLREPQLPTGPIVWCLRPKGTFGFYRCSVLYPDLSFGTYWSPTDDTGGS